MTVHDLRDDAPRYVAEALKITAHNWMTLDDLAGNYTLPRPNNLADLRDEIRADLGAGPLDDHEVRAWLIRDAVGRIGYENDTIEHDEDHETFRLAAGIEADTLRLDGEPLIRGRKLPDLFTPGSGAWVDNLRSYVPEGLKELRESMQNLGWLRQLPAIQDENGVVIVGHRRLDVAAELGIEPVVETVRFGEGEAADAQRAMLAIASNVGAEKISPADRKKIAADLYGAGWSMAKIGELLKVSAMSVSRDLRGFNAVLNPVEKAKRGGRPRKQHAEPASPKSEPEPAAVAPEPAEAEDVDEPQPEPVDAQPVVGTGPAKKARKLTLDEKLRSHAPVLAGHMDALATEVEKLLAEAADAGLADEIEAFFDEPFRRLRCVMNGTPYTTPTTDEEDNE